MSGGEIKRCAAPHAEDEIAPATGFVRYVRNTDGTEVINGPYCDGCQVLRCRHFRHREMTREIREVGAVPLDYRERASKVRPGRITDGMVKAYAQATNAGNGGALVTIRAGLVAALTRRELERRTEPELHPINLDPYPASVGEVADEIARYVLELESGPARGLLHDVIDRLNREYARRNVVVPHPEELPGMWEDSDLHGGEADGFHRD